MTHGINNSSGYTQNVYGNSHTPDQGLANDANPSTSATDADAKSHLANDRQASNQKPTAHNTQALQQYSHPSASTLAVNATRITADRTVTLEYSRPGKGSAVATISDKNITFKISSPSFIDQEAQLHTTPGSTSTPTEAEYSINFADIENLGESDQQLISGLESALQSADLSSTPAPTRAATELAKARLSVLKDPSLWADVRTRLTKSNVHKLADGKFASVRSEALVTITPEHYETRTVKSSTLGGGRSSHRANVLVPASYTVRIDGKEVTGERSKDGNSFEVDGKPYALRFDDNTNQWKAVTEKVPLTETQARNQAISAEMAERTSSAFVNTLPVVTGESGVELSTIGTDPARSDNIELSYARAEGAFEQVTVSKTGITFNTYLPADMPGTTDKAGFNTLKTKLLFKDINSWSMGNTKQIDALNELLSNVDESSLNDSQVNAISTIKLRLGTLQAPAFWAKVNADIATRLDATLPDVGPISIDERFDVVVDRDLKKDGTTKVSFTMVSETGEKTKFEPNDDDTVTIEGIDYPIATDGKTGEFVVAKIYSTPEQITNQAIKKEFTALETLDDVGARTNGSPLSALGSTYGGLINPDGPAPISNDERAIVDTAFTSVDIPTADISTDDATPIDTASVDTTQVDAGKFQQTLNDFLNDPAEFINLLNSVLNDADHA